MRSIIVALLLATAGRAAAQLPNADYSGVAATGIDLRKLASIKRVLVIGAHPDDEDNQLLSALSLGQGASVAYLSLTRGEGGQNSIGRELGPALGILRTEELLAAHRLDLAEQYFTRAYDFGFSKTAEETLAHWPRDSVLGDVVAVVRRYRPDVIIAIFSGTPADGHGQHQVSGMLAREAFTAAADPHRFPDQIKAGLHVHRPLKLFQATRFRGKATQRISTGRLDPLIGRSYAQIGSESRARHRSQDQGGVQPLGPRATSVGMLASHVAASDSTLFAGIDTTLGARARTARESASVVRALQRYDSLIAAAPAGLSAFNTDAVAELLVKALAELGAAVPHIRDENVRFNVQSEQTDLGHSLLRAHGVIIDALSSAELVVPGQSFAVDVGIWNSGRTPITVTSVEPPMEPATRTVAGQASTSEIVAPDSLITRKFTVTVPADAQVSQPYFLRKPLLGAAYAWPAGESYAGAPFVEPMFANVAIDVRGVHVTMRTVLTRRAVDPRQGERRRAVQIAPAFALQPGMTTVILPIGALAIPAQRSIAASLDVLSNGRGGHLVVRPEVPSGWRTTPQEVTLHFDGPDETRTAAFAIEPDRNTTAGKYDVRFAARDSSGRRYDLTQRTLEYPHVVNRVWFEPAVLTVTVVDVKFARGMRIGYIVGVDDDVPDVLEMMGMAVERLDKAALATADLRKFDAVVVGSRAYELRTDLVTYNSRVLDYGRGGGNVVVLYQRDAFTRGRFAPHELRFTSPAKRITDENAPVKMLDAHAPVLTRPNRITQADFQDWVQERALYMPAGWAPEYQPVLEMNDPGEAPEQGAILTARLGAGFYTYTGVPFFREIPAGVPGALRLFVNLLSVGIKDASL